MPTTLQFRRGTTSQNDSFTGAAGELSVDTDKDTLRVHDGSTAGGFELLTAGMTATLTNKTLTSPNITGLQLGGVAVTATAAELNKLDGCTATTTELNYVDGVTSNIQTQLDGKITAGATSGNGISGSASSGTFTVTSNATNANTASTIVFRDSNGSFSANIVTATSTTARYADLAEKYTSDFDYEPGTVLKVGGTKELTQTVSYAESAVAGIVSTAPAHLMNADLEDGTVVDLALTGRVPCKVTGTITKGDLITSSDTPGVGTALETSEYTPGCVIGKALEDYADEGVGLIEVLVGKV